MQKALFALEHDVIALALCLSMTFPDHALAWPGPERRGATLRAI